MVIIEQLNLDTWANHLIQAEWQLPDDERRVYVRRCVSLITTFVLDPRGIFLARDGEQMAAIQVCVPLAGKSCLFWAPVGPQDVADSLVQAGLTWCRGLECKIAQAFLDSHETTGAAALMRCGFRHVTCMVRLRHDLTDIPVEPTKVNLVPYSDAVHATFGATLARTYEGTLDCPELCGRRSMEEVLAGHRGEGKFDPNFWWLIFEGDAPAGVLMLMEQLDGVTWDLAYLGVVPEFRRRGLGRRTLGHALQSLRTQPATQLTVAVDGRNAPAMRLYEAHGFVKFESSEVLLYFI
jgi:GNAT superfamily N-acetyltransferase